MTGTLWIFYRLHRCRTLVPRRAPRLYEAVLHSRQQPWLTSPPLSQFLLLLWLRLIRTKDLAEVKIEFERLGRLYIRSKMWNFRSLGSWIIHLRSEKDSLECFFHDIEDYSSSSAGFFFPFQSLKFLSYHCPLLLWTISNHLKIFEAGGVISGAYFIVWVLESAKESKSRRMINRKGLRLIEGWRKIETAITAGSGLFWLR